jgi:hypothetical protein
MALRPERRVVRMKTTPTIKRSVIAAALLALAGAGGMAMPADGNPNAIPFYTPPLNTAPSTGGPFSPIAAGVTLVLPMVAGGFLAAALMRARRSACPPCPSCGSRTGAVVGPVGAYRRACRCHACGFLWEHDDMFGRGNALSADQLNTTGKHE